MLHLLQVNFWWVFLLASSFFIHFLIRTRNVLTKYIRSSSHRSCFDRLRWSLWFDTYDHLSIQSTFLLFLAYSWLISDVLDLQTLRLQFLQVILRSDLSLLHLSFHYVNSSYWIFAVHSSSRPPSWSSWLLFPPLFLSSFCLVFKFPFSNLRFLLLLLHSNLLFNSI